jgi:NADH-quinone oxidoreductase subunit M
MYNFPILSFLTFYPLVGILLIWLLGFSRAPREGLVKAIALFVTLVNFATSLVLLYNFDKANPAMQFAEKQTWIVGYDIFYQLGVDGISIYFVILTTLLFPICILASWNSIQSRIKEYYALFLMLETFVIGSFCATDLLLFYIFFEAVLIPMYLIIGIWGGQNRVYAAYKFFLYTLLGSVFLLLAIVYIYYQTGTTDIELLTAVLPGFELHVQNLLWLAMFASFAVKIPMFPVHTWLPDAHVQALTTFPTLFLSFRSSR